MSYEMNYHFQEYFHTTFGKAPINRDNTIYLTKVSSVTMPMISKSSSDGKLFFHFHIPTKETKKI